MDLIFTEFSKKGKDIFTCKRRLGFKEQKESGVETNMGLTFPQLIFVEQMLNFVRNVAVD